MTLAEVFHGDCRKLLQGAIKLPLIDCVLTDPPYGVAFKSTFGKKKNAIEKYQTEIEGDETVAEAIERFHTAMMLMLPMLADTCELYVFSDWHVSPSWQLYLESLAEFDISLEQLIIWEKGYPGLGDFTYNWGQGHEFIYYLKKGKRKVPYRRSGILHVDKVRPGTNVHPCLPPDEKVMTPFGYRPIKEIEVGHLVLAADGRYHQVTDTTESWCDDGVVSIRAAGSMGSATTTRNHPWLIWRPTRKGNAIISHEVAWLDASEVQIGDYSLTPVNDSGASHSMSTDKAWATGLWLAQGHLNQSGNSTKVSYPRWTVHSDVAHDFADRIHHCTTAKVSVYRDTRSNAAAIVAFDAVWAAEMVRYCGLGAHDKFASPEILDWSHDLRLAFINGYLDGDGWRRADHADRAKTVSDDLVPTLGRVAESVGYFFAVKRDTPAVKSAIIDGRVIKPSPCWAMEFATDGPNRRPKWAEHEGTRYSLHRVQEVTHLPYEGIVLNLSVEGSHTFQTLSGMTHNTQKPVELLDILIKYSTDPGQFVFDPFAGSGSTVIAARDAGRDAIGIEEDINHFNTAKRRLSEGGLLAL